MSSGKLLLGVLAGVAAGALIGILFAPEKGSVTRKKISKKSDDYVEDLKDKFNQLLEKVKGTAEAAEDKIEEAMENGLAKVEKLKLN